MPTGMSGPDAAEEKLDGAGDAVREFVRAGEVHGPLADDGVVETIHELGQVRDGKGAGNVAAFLALRQNLAQQAESKFLMLAHLGRTDGVHSAGENNRMPQGTVGFRVVSEFLVEAAQMVGGGRLARKLVFQVVGDAGETTAADFAQNGVFAWEIAEKSRLADFEGLDDVVNACFFVTALAEQADGRIDDFLAEASFLAFAETERFSGGGPIRSRMSMIRVYGVAPERGESPSF